ncbi:MAG: hypothetical protein QM790_13375 [Nibricoccus sp.]
MTDKNRVSAVITPEILNNVLQAASGVESNLPFLVSLENGEVKELPRVGPRTIEFDQQCETYMKKHPELVPSFVDVDALAKDRVLRSQLLEVSRTFGLLATRIEDTLAVVSHEIYDADLAFYQNVKQAAKRGVADAAEIQAALSERFPGRGAAKAAKTEPTK